MYVYIYICVCKRVLFWVVYSWTTTPIVLVASSSVRVVFAIRGIICWLVVWFVSHLMICWILVFVFVYICRFFFVIACGVWWGSYHVLVDDLQPPNYLSIYVYIDSIGKLVRPWYLLKITTWKDLVMS